MKYKKTAAVLLAGGESRRFGYDKKNLYWQGISLLEKTIEAVQEIFTQTAIALRYDQKVENLCIKGVKIIHDSIKNRGPLAAIHAAMQMNNCQQIFVTTIDCPKIDREIIEAMLSLSNDNDAVLLSSSGMLQSLFAIYNCALLPEIERELMARRNKVKNILNIAPRIAIVNDWKRNWYYNVNTKEDWDDFMMKEELTCNKTIFKYDGCQLDMVEDKIIKEIKCSIWANGTELFCGGMSPHLEQELLQGVMWINGICNALDLCDVEYQRYNDYWRISIKYDENNFIQHDYKIDSTSTVCIDAETLLRCQEDFLSDQKLFEATGGSHRIAVYDKNGCRLIIVDDVCRGSAFFKVIGCAIMKRYAEWQSYIIITSSRLNIMLLDIAAKIGCKFVAGVSAPTSGAIELAMSNDITLIGFLRQRRFNVYNAMWRLRK